MFKRFWWVFLVMLPVGAMAGLLVAAVVTYVMPKKYESEAVLEVKPLAAGLSPLGSQPAPQLLATVLEVMKSRNSLEKVVVNLDLTNRWMVDKEAAVQILKGIVTAQNIRGTDLISIRVRHTNKVDTRDITEEVAIAYKEYRAAIEGRAAEAMLQELNKAVRDQEDKVEERRKALSTIVRTKGIDAIKAEDDGLSRRINAISATDRQEKTPIRSLLKYDNDQLMAFASGIDLPDNTVRKLYLEYLEAKRRLEAMKIKGLGDDHPTVRAARENIAAKRSQLDDGIVRFRETLTAQADAQDYINAKREFETDQELLQAMKLKQMGETVARKIPSQSVEIHEEPVIAESPVSPNVTLNLSLGTALGFLLSPLLALPVMWLLNRRKRSAAGCLAASYSRL